MENLDVVSREVRFAMVLGGQKSERPESDRVFQFGTYKGRPARFTYLYAHGRVEDEANAKPKPATEAEFDALIAQYDADPRWVRS